MILFQRRVTHCGSVSKHWHCIIVPHWKLQCRNTDPCLRRHIIVRAPPERHRVPHESVQSWPRVHKTTAAFVWNLGPFADTVPNAKKLSIGSRTRAPVLVRTSLRQFSPTGVGWRSRAPMVVQLHFGRTSTFGVVLSVLAPVYPPNVVGTVVFPWCDCRQYSKNVTVWCCHRPPANFVKLGVASADSVIVTASKTTSIPLL
jgi:hypothetical protein